MNENLRLSKILRNCPKGMSLWSPFIGEVEFLYVKDNIIYVDRFGTEFTFFSDGKYSKDGECVLFPSKDQRDWSKFKTPGKKFNPEEFKPFDQVLVRRNYYPSIWYPKLFDTIDVSGGVTTINNDNIWTYCIPYNDNTKNLVRTSNDCPEYYKWWKK